MHGGWDEAQGGADPWGEASEPPPVDGVRPSPGVEADDLPTVLAALTEIQRLADLVQCAALWQHADSDSVAAVRASAVAARKVQAAHLATVADLDGRPGVLAGAPAKAEARSFLQNALHRTRSQARLDVAAAHALRPGADAGQRGLPRLGAAFAAGEVSREHVDAAMRVMEALPRDLLPAIMLDEDGAPILDENGQPMCAGDVVDERITRHAREHDSYALAQLGKHLKDVIDPDGAFDPGSCLKRSLRTWWDHAGMFNLRGELDPAAGALIESVLDQLSDPQRFQTDGDEGTLLNVPDGRNTGMRKADALLEVFRAAAGSGTLGTRGGEPPRIVITTRVEDVAAARDAQPAGDGGCLSTGSHINASLLSRLSCDAVLQRALLAPSGAILDLGREVRTVSPAQRRALAARDQGCMVPGCTAPAPWCEGHHVRWWRHSGETNIANMALLCSRHHTEVHTGMWIVQMRDGVPWVIPPDWIDPRQRPQRNQHHHQTQQIRDLGTQLRLNLGHGTTSAGQGSSPPRAGSTGSDPPGTGSAGSDPPVAGSEPPGGDEPDHTTGT